MDGQTEGQTRVRVCGRVGDNRGDARWGNGREEGRRDERQEKMEKDGEEEYEGREDDGMRVSDNHDLQVSCSKSLTAETAMHSDPSSEDQTLSARALWDSPMRRGPEVGCHHRLMANCAPL